MTMAPGVHDPSSFDCAEPSIQQLKINLRPSRAPNLAGSRRRQYGELKRSGSRILAPRKRCMNSAYLSEG